MKYNYIIFNSVESKIDFNPNGYYAICYNDVRNHNQIQCIDIPLQGYCKFWRYLYALHHSARINERINLPFKKIWYPYYFKNEFKDSKEICFILQIRLPIFYLQYLKEQYHNCKFVSIYRDLRKITEINNPEYPNHPIFDLEMTIDKNEAKLYGWHHFEEFESKIDVPKSSSYFESDVFFAGKAKDRLERLLKAYNIFTKAGLRCKYYLTGVPQNKRINLPGIEYAEKFMPYSEMLYHTINSKGILEINQYEAVGYTSRFLEAVMYNKRLITDNKDVMLSKFYSSDNIMCISDILDIDPSFVSSEKIVDYHYNGEFSPIHLIEKIDLLLTQ
mgnify:FL=1